MSMSVNERKWTIQDSGELYHIPHWGTPYFAVNALGNIVYSPTGVAGGGNEIDIKGLVDELGRRGIVCPLLIRFNDILKARVEKIYGAFSKAIDEYGYKGSYRAIMPIKVNQQRHVVEEIVKHGRAYGLGLEAGSKPELFIAIALLDNDGVLICNGYKDEEYIETALYAQRLGLRTYIVLDRYAELELLIEASKRMRVKPHIGVRLKLNSKGSGRWKESSGLRSKFGLSSGELVKAVERLKAAEMLDCFEMVHFHLGSQITMIRSVKEAAREAAHFYVNLRRMGATSLSIVDVGGGLAVDYDGSQTSFHSSKNYSMQEYANDLVWALQDICDVAGEPHPQIFTEAGRALVAHHSVLVFNVVGTHSFLHTGSLPSAAQLPNGQHHGPTQEGAPQVLEGFEIPTNKDQAILTSMWDACKAVSHKNYQEVYNDIVQLREESTTLFSHGIIDLKTRARAEEIFWLTCQQIQRLTVNASYVPDDLALLNRELSDTYYCNFSVFQSLPDAWAVGHLFPIVPIHRLDEEPKREAILADLTCDSDGKIDKFIDLRDVGETLRLHSPNGAPYYLGAFLVGAYQEILGDLHNLFGDTNAVHVSVDEHCGYKLEHLVEGDTVSEVLGYVEYERTELLRQVRTAAEAAVRAGRFTLEEFRQFMRCYEEGLLGYTYLENID